MRGRYIPTSYGPRGSEAINNALRSLFVDQIPLITPVSCAPLDVPAFLRRVLVPEAAVALIAEDLNISPEEAKQVKHDSSAFGRAVFGTQAEDALIIQNELDREAKEERREKKRKSAEKKAQKLAAEEKARALQVANAPPGMPWSLQT